MPCFTILFKAYKTHSLSIRTIDCRYCLWR